jgi:hypothetical protein
MLTITPEARAHALNKGGILFLEYFILAGGCCVPFQPEPAVRIGRPCNQDHYREENIDGLTVFIPHNLPEEKLVITVNSFLWYRKLSIEGWRYF